MNKKNELVFNFNKKEVRTVVLNNEPYFVGKDVAEILGYNEPRKAISRHVDSEDGMKYPILTNGGTQEMTVINESGLYSLILSSKLPQAKEFKRWVTKEVLPTIRKTGSYNIPSNPMEALELMFETQKQSNEKLEEMDKRISNVENTTTIVSHQQLALSRVASATAIRVLGGKNSDAYRCLSKKVFSSMWHDYKEFFKIASYKDTLKTDYKRAIEYLENWKPDTNLTYEIQMCGFEL